MEREKTVGRRNRGNKKITDGKDVEREKTSRKEEVGNVDGPAVVPPGLSWVSTGSVPSWSSHIW